MTNDELNKILLNKILREREKRIEEINKELEDLMFERKLLEHDIHGIEELLKGEKKWKLVTKTDITKDITKKGETKWRKKLKKK